MNARTLAIGLGIALAASVAANLFAATAAYTALNEQDRVTPHAAGTRGPQTGRPSSRELVAALQPDSQERVREALRAAGRAAHPDFQQARELREQAIAAAAAEPFDSRRVDALLDQSRAAEVRGRERLEADALAILGTLPPADRASFARILDRGKGGAASGRRDGGHPPRK